MFKKMFLRGTAVLLVILMVFAVSTSGFAHSGRTDSSGGHKDNKNKSGLGSYHYHCGGNPPHLHSGGVCPYSKPKVSATKKPKATATPVPVKYVDGIAVPDSPDFFPIGMGSRGTIVKNLQEALIYMGYLEDTADGIYGKMTDEAVKRYCEDVFDDFIYEEQGVDEELYISILKDYNLVLELRDAA